MGESYADDPMHPERMVESGTFDNDPDDEDLGDDGEDDNEEDEDEIA